MSEYTPTTDQVRAVFIAAPGHKTHAGSRHEAFERWLASITTHTPTGDEREGLIAEWASVHQGPDAHSVLLEMLPIGDQMSLALQDALRELAGFRRSEVPEPSAKDWARRISAAREKAIAKGYTPEHDAKHGVRHLLRWAIDYARRGKAEDSSGLIAAAIDLADVAYAELERLRHVADTTRAVSEALRTRYASDSQAAYFMRQIDAALEAVAEPQGEPSEAQVDAAIAAYKESARMHPGRAHMLAALRAAGGAR